MKIIRIFYLKKKKNKKKNGGKVFSIFEQACFRNGVCCLISKATFQIGYYCYN